MNEFPGNSKRVSSGPSREQPAIAAKGTKVNPVVEGEVIRRKKPFGKRLRETLLGGDGPTVWEYVMGDILIPGIRDMFADIVTGGMERALYGESRSSHRRPSRFGPAPGRVAYNAFSAQPVGVRGREDPRALSGRRGPIYNPAEEAVFSSRPDAERVLDGMYAYLDQYQEVPIRTLNELLGQTSPYTDERYGWTDLRGSRIQMVRGGGYMLDLPDPVLLEK